jgi:hypothetical protein
MKYLVKGTKNTFRIFTESGLILAIFANSGLDEESFEDDNEIRDNID